jgi:hypothetical protein
MPLWYCLMFFSRRSLSSRLGFVPLSNGPRHLLATVRDSRDPRPRHGGESGGRRVRPRPLTSTRNETHHPQRRTTPTTANHARPAATTRRRPKVTPAAPTKPAPADPVRDHKMSFGGFRWSFHGGSHDLSPPARWPNHGLPAAWPNCQLGA